MEVSRLTRDGTAEPVTRDQILGVNADREIFTFPVQLTTSRIGNLTRLTLTLAISYAHTAAAVVTHICIIYGSIFTSILFVKVVWDKISGHTS